MIAGTPLSAAVRLAGRRPGTVATAGPGTSPARPVLPRKAPHQGAFALCRCTTCADLDRQFADGAQQLMLTLPTVSSRRRA